MVLKKRSECLMNEKLTKAKLDEIRQRVAQATGGKWVAEANDGLMDHQTYYRVFSDIETEFSDVTFLIHKLESKEDADFIANARQDIPRLLDYITELERKLQKKEYELTECNRVYLELLSKQEFKTTEI
ncbi:hypothetical protein [Bacillus sp. AG1]|uniref:hypothetical protein n=1 Tax=Bacillus sp. AG1 TaxID=480127 RepID=UPI002AB52AA6|nr:hypothetical protein [Bacillus sp. AG1]MDY7904110.1 hypothetical protein [Bacillus sp. AG1]